MKVLLINVGAKVCFIRNANLVVAYAVKPDGSIRTWGEASYGGAYASDYNLALDKPATESSTDTSSIPLFAGHAADGNTDGEFLKTPLLRFLYLKINTHNLNFC
jgi:hypothetical protein